MRESTKPRQKAQQLLSYQLLLILILFVAASCGGVDQGRSDADAQAALEAVRSSAYADLAELETEQLLINQRIAVQQGEVERADANAAALQDLSLRKMAETEEIREQLESTTDENERERLQAELDAANAEAEALSSRLDEAKQIAETRAAELRELEREAEKVKKRIKDTEDAIPKTKDAGNDKTENAGAGANEGADNDKEDNDKEGDKKQPECKESTSGSTTSSLSPFQQQKCDDVLGPGLSPNESAFGGLCGVSIGGPPVAPGSDEGLIAAASAAAGGAAMFIAESWDTSGMISFCGAGPAPAGLDQLLGELNGGFIELIENPAGGDPLIVALIPVEDVPGFLDAVNQEDTRTFVVDRIDAAEQAFPIKALIEQDAEFAATRITAQGLEAVESDLAGYDADFKLALAPSLLAELDTSQLDNVLAKDLVDAAPGAVHALAADRLSIEIAAPGSDVADVLSTEQLVDVGIDVPAGLSIESEQGQPDSTSVTDSTEVEAETDADTTETTADADAETTVTTTDADTTDTTGTTDTTNPTDSTETTTTTGSAGVVIPDSGDLLLPTSSLPSIIVPDLPTSSLPGRISPNRSLP